MKSLLFLVCVIISAAYAREDLTLPPLPYDYKALEPVLSEHLLRLHHDKHFQSYMNHSNTILRVVSEDQRLNETLRKLAEKPIEEVLTRLHELPEHYYINMRQQGGGYLNHKFFFSILQKPTATAEENKPTGVLLEAIEKSFGTYDKFRELFSGAAVNFFGSGWVWLYIDSASKMLVLNYTANQDNPIMFDKNHVVILGIDLWEHAYYPVYENRRKEYVDNFWRIINWSQVSKLYTEGKAKRSDL